MTKNSNVLIAALTLTAIILGVVLLSASNQPAQASMLNAQDDFSLMTVGNVNDADENLVIIDKGAERMIVYKLANNNFNVIAAYDLGKGMAGPGR